MLVHPLLAIVMKMAMMMVVAVVGVETAVLVVVMVLSVVIAVLFGVVVAVSVVEMVKQGWYTHEERCKCPEHGLGGVQQCYLSQHVELEISDT